jgi:hypothetical protein
MSEEVTVRIMVLAAALSFTPSLCAAQVVEVGGTIAAGCVGSDGSACGGGTHPMAGGHAGWWATEGIELSLRIARQRLPAYRFEAGFPTLVRGRVDGRTHEFVSVQFAKHFGRADTVRPMVGFGSGWFGRAQRITCEPGCDGTAGLPIGGDRREWMADVIVLAGLSGIVKDRWVWRGGWLAHRFANDENSTMEWFVGLGYRFGTR